jgi:hypothetical protein
MLEALALWVFAAFFNGEHRLAGFPNPAMCEVARAYMESKFVEDGEEDGDLIDPKCTAHLLIEPKARLQ